MNNFKKMLLILLIVLKHPCLNDSKNKLYAELRQLLVTKIQILLVLNRKIIK